MSIEMGKQKNWGSRSGKSKTRLKETDLSLLYMSDEVLEELAKFPTSISDSVKQILKIKQDQFDLADATPLEKVFKSKKGTLYKGDCLSFLSSLEDNSVDCIFADPPFNLNKTYKDSRGDNISDLEYMVWTKQWLLLCAQKLKLGGSLFVYNIPKWSIPTATVLKSVLDFKSLIAVDLTLSLPIANRLYPSHYSLLYFTKGSPNIFNPPRVPIETCVKCGSEQKDYGGYKSKLNPQGMNLRDVWTDIPPVRHSKYKNRDANELSLKLLDRILDIATNEDSVVVDPFGGSGTTFVAAELKNRKWLGVELGDCDPIIDRMKNLETDKGQLEKYETQKNTLFTDKALLLRHNKSVPTKNYRIEQAQLDRVFKKKNNLKFE